MLHRAMFGDVADHGNRAGYGGNDGICWLARRRKCPGLHPPNRVCSASHGSERSAKVVLPHTPTGSPPSMRPALYRIGIIKGTVKLQEPYS